MSQITQSQRTILKYLAARDSATLSQINDHLGVVGRHSAHITRLAESGHVTHHPNEDAARYSITKRGERALRELQQADRGAITPPRTNHGAGDYLPEPWRPEVARPGCLDNVNIPSLMGSRRVYRRDATEVPA